MVNPVNNTTGTTQVGASQAVMLRPPSELYGTNKPQNTNNQQNIYKEDHPGFPTPLRLVSELTQFGVGALSGYKYHQTFITASNNIGQATKTGGVKELLTAFGTNGKVLGVAAYNAAGVNAILSGGVSALINSGSVMTGHDTLRGATANVVTDTIKGAVSGVGGLAGGGIAALSLSLFKVGGTPLVIAGVIGGAIGASVTNKLFKTEDLRLALRGEKK
jgi:hypothetical protein